MAYSSRALNNFAEDPGTNNSALLSKLGWPLFETVFILKEILYFDFCVPFNTGWFINWVLICDNIPLLLLFMVDCEKINAIETIIIPKW